VTSVRLSDLAVYIKSANAGATQITIDAGFADAESINEEAIAEIYHVDPALVQIHHYSPANTIKITLPRAVVSGGFDERDFDGVQQYVPILFLEVDLAPLDVETSRP
jgi:hypothetical protein